MDLSTSCEVKDLKPLSSGLLQSVGAHIQRLAYLFAHVAPDAWTSNATLRARCYGAELDLEAFEVVRSMIGTKAKRHCCSFRKLRPPVRAAISAKSGIVFVAKRRRVSEISTNTNCSDKGAAS